MTLAGRTIALLVAVLLPAWLGAVALVGLQARSALAGEMAARGADAVSVLARALRGRTLDDARAWLAQESAQAAHGRVALYDAGGAMLVEHRRPGASPAGDAAGGPLAGLWRLRAGPVETEVELAGGIAARLVLEPDPTRPQARLARLVAEVALWLGAIALVAGAALHAALRHWRAPLRAAVEHAHAIEQARFVTAELPQQPELREVTRAMNSMAQRLRDLFDAQAQQVAQLQQQAQTDAVTGLMVRGQFTGRLAELLSDRGGPAAALLLVRAAGLERLNERHGREATDRLLAALADLMLTYVERVPGAIAGRLNGTDFALALPVAGIAQETAESLREAIEASPAARLAGAEFQFGGCDGLRGLGAGEALAAADAALARAEAEERVAIDDLPDVQGGGARAWRDQIADALAQQRVQLGAYPVVDPHGALIHFECPLRVQLQPGGDYQVARRWLALAARSRLLPQVDLAAVDLALAAIAEDGQPRCVHVAPRSFAAPEFAETLQRRLERAGALRGRLSIEWTETSRAADSAALRAAVAAWRAAGVTIGVEHAGASPRALPELKAIGADYVKVDARHLRGIADDEVVRSYAASLVALIKGLGLRAYAEGVDTPRDLAALWALGFDGATGAAVAPVR